MSNTIYNNVIYNNVILLPKKQEQLLHRRRLDILLSKAVEHPLVTVTAGAGYGKTQAVSLFLSHSSSRVMWFQLSKLDNHLARFWEEIVYSIALQNKETAIQLSQLGFPDSLAKFNQFLHILVKVGYAREQIVFVFDDFHLIHNETITRFVENFILAKLENICIILISRKKLNLNLANMYTNDLVSQVTAEDLQFTLSETEEYLKLNNITMMARELKRVHSHTQGWPLALYLVSLSIKKGIMISNDPIAGAMPLIFEMIDRELFSGYAPQVQKFLIKASLLNTLPIGVIKVLAEDNFKKIAEIINTNMFINFNSYSGQYNFHHLFLEFLKGKQEYLTEQEISDTYIKAADWCAANELKIEALSYYDMCNRYDKIWNIMLHYGCATFPKTTADFLISLIDKFPEEFVKKNPLVQVIHAGLLLNNADLQAAKKKLIQIQKDLETLPLTEDNKVVLGEIYYILGMISLSSRNYDFKDLFRKADEYAPKGVSVFDNSGKFVNTQYAIILNSPAPGELKKMEEALLYAMPYASKATGGCAHGLEYLASAEAAFFTGNVKKAAENAYEAIYMAREKQVSDIASNGYFLLMRIEASNGNYHGIVSHLEQLRTYVNSLEDKKNFNGMLDIAEGWFYISVGQTERVANWIMDDTLNGYILAPYSVGMERLVKSKCFLKEEKYYELLAWLGQLEDLVRRNKIWLFLLDILIDKCIAFHYVQEDEKAIEVLQEAYEIAHGNNLVMQFAARGNNMRTVINAANRFSGHKIPMEWLNSIYSRATIFAKRIAYITDMYNKENDLIKTEIASLSRRENEILLCLYQGLTREEIAQSLYISINTVKSTLNNIYGKLGAINSNDAIRIAIQKQIL